MLRKIDERLGSFLQIILLCPLIKTSSIAVSHIGSHLYEGSYFEGSFSSQKLQKTG